MGNILDKAKTVTPPVQRSNELGSESPIKKTAETQQLSQMQQAANNSPQVQQLAQLKKGDKKSPPLVASGEPAKKEDPKQHVPKHNHDEIDGKRKKKQITASVTEAYNMIERAKGNVSKDSKVYKRWMDAGKADTGNTEARVSHVKDGVDKIAHVLKEEEIILKKYELNDGEEDSTYAYVYNEEEEHNIYLGGAFWGAKTGGRNSKAGTIIHELSHRVHGTEDHVYGEADAKKLAKEDPALATTNADNYEFLAENS